MATHSPQRGSIQNRKRRGRGNASGSGGECGRGHKGQKSRSGYSKKPGFEGGQMPLYRRIPKLRGFKNPFRINYAAVNLAQIEQFCEEDVVDLDLLQRVGLARKGKKIKILGLGDLKTKKTISAHSFSKTAIEKIEKSGSRYEIIS